MWSARLSARCSIMCPRGFESSASAGRAMAAGPAGLFIRRPPRSVRSPRASPVPCVSLISWSPSTAITFRFTGRAKSSPGTGSISIARLSRTGWAALVGGWSRCRPASQRMCLDQPSCLPTTRRSRCSIPAAAAPRPAGCGSMRATIFDREEADVDAEWQLTEAAGLGMTVRAAAGVRFIRPVQKNNRRLYEFEVLDGVVPPNVQLHLRKVDETGTEQVLRRRLRMLTTLSTQSELANMLADPRGRLRTYQDDPLVEDGHFAKLDE